MNNPVGRPALPPEQRKTHKRIALYPPTYRKVKRIAAIHKVKIVDLIATLIDKTYNDEGEKI